ASIDTEAKMAAESDLAGLPAPAPEPLAMERMVNRAAPSATRDMLGGAAAQTAPLYVDGDNFASFEENRLKITAEEPVSTFSIDVDTASYSYVRSLLEDGFLPDPDAVRL